MFKRIIDLETNLDDATFLLGARQTGKSTLLAERFPSAIYFDLLDSTLRRRLQARPELLREMLSSIPDGSIVVIDEIPKVSDLLDESQNERLAEIDSLASVNPIAAIDALTEIRAGVPLWATHT